MSYSVTVRYLGNRITISTTKEGLLLTGDNDEVYMQYDRKNNTIQTNNSVSIGYISDVMSYVKRGNFGTRRGFVPRFVKTLASDALSCLKDMSKSSSLESTLEAAEVA